MEYLLIGKYANTHGIKGEIRLISDSHYKSQIFKNGMHIYIGKDKQLYTINTYRQHKQYDMLTLDNINNINDIINLKGSYVYISKEDLNTNDDKVFIEDLIGYEVYINNNSAGKVTEILKGKANDVLVVSEKRILIPYVKSFILDVDNKHKKIIVEDVRGLVS